jgi:UDP-2,4-diacetamido-2,4,6-trideoxy-beta-L-altropyranose hydrolase
MAETEQRIRIRDVGPSDAKAIFELSNHPSVRKVSFQNAPLQWQEHLRWFEATRTDPLCGFYVAESGSEILGQVRFRLDGARAIVSISIDPRFRGKGLGSMLYYEALSAFRRRHRAEEFVAIIRKSNHDSIAFFRKLGFNAVSTERIGGEEAVIMVSYPGQSGGEG